MELENAVALAKWLIAGGKSVTIHCRFDKEEPFYWVECEQYRKLEGHVARTIDETARQYGVRLEIRANPHADDLGHSLILKFSEDARTQYKTR